jgi:hypothetical protein
MGEVTSVTSHSVTVRTTRGETMDFETDSRTVMPMNLAPESRVKIEFHLMENGTHHAGRITVIETGSADWDRYDRELSAMPSSNEREKMVSETNASASMGNSGTARNELSSDRERNESERTAAESREDELPRTASRQPLLLGLGLSAAALGLGLAIIGRRRAV